NTGLSGQVVYNTTSLRNNRLSFRDSLAQHFFNKPVLLPAMTWKDNVGPAAASSLNAVLQPGNTILLSWTKPAATIIEMDKVKQFAIYRANGTVPDINNSSQLIAVTNTDIENFTDSEILANGNWYYVVTALDRLHNESNPSNTASIILGPLPLTLLYFNAKKIESSQVLLNWKTTNEIETDYFEVERSINHSNTFISISKISANSGSAVFSYSFLDKMIVESGVYYYRLKMLDKDGSYTYSEIRKVDIDSKPSSIFVYPVPVASAGKLQIVWPGTNGFQHYKLVSMEGKVVMQSRLPFNAGTATLQLHTNIKSGTYLLQFFAAKQPYQIQIIVQ
ncbi:MAG: T9SS type A sorting domain-containing protein, partial [Ferruginibacter sp.]